MKVFCRENNIGFIDGWDHFTSRKHMYARDGVHLSNSGVSVLAVWHNLTCGPIRKVRSSPITRIHPTSSPTGKPIRQQERIPRTLRRKSHPTCGPQVEGPLTLKGEHPTKKKKLDTNNEMINTCAEKLVSKGSVNSGSNNWESKDKSHLLHRTNINKNNSHKRGKARETLKVYYTNSRSL
ncbi:hypothetical protein SK128_019793, partial [Halocaridina rubra]